MDASSANKLYSIKLIFISKSRSKEPSGEHVSNIDVIEGRLQCIQYRNLFD